MSLARALTTRYRKHDAPISFPTRAMSVRKPDGSIDRAQISLPTELISTTNVLAYEAPDIHASPADRRTPSSASTSSTLSYDSDSNSSPGFASSASSDTTPDNSSIESLPCSPDSSHLSTYFSTKSHPGSPVTSQHQLETAHFVEDIPEVPAIPAEVTAIPPVPSRALSHTKQSHQAIARKRSMRKVSIVQAPEHASPLFTDSSHMVSSPVRTSLEIFSTAPEVNHPFGSELQQVNELAEEYGVVKDAGTAGTVTVWDEEEQYLAENGFHKFAAGDYIQEIQGLFGGVFEIENENTQFPPAAGWI